MSEKSLGRSHRPVTAGRIPVPAAALAEKLEDIRRQSALLDAEQELNEKGAAAPRVRATLSNLIMFVSDHARSVSGEAVDRAITELCVSHPSRFFVVSYDSGNGSDEEQTAAVQTAVSSRCVKANSGVNVCSEEVYISVKHDGLAVVPNLLLSLLVPDVETVLLVLSDPCLSARACSCGKFRDDCSSLLCGIQRISDMLVYDSSVFEGYTSSLSALFNDTQRGFAPEALGISGRDLSWIRTKRWRSLVAEQFDAERLLQSVNQISRVVFYCEGDAREVACGKLPADALLFAGWFVNSLSWDCLEKAVDSTEEKAEIRCQDSLGKEVGLEFIGLGERDITEDPCSLVRVEIYLNCDQGETRVKIERSMLDQSAKISTELLSAKAAAQKNACEICLRCAPFLCESLETSVIAGITSQGGDPEFDQALRLSHHLARLVTS